MSSPLLEVDGLKMYYETSSGPVKAVDGITFSLNKGETLGLAGESGCGKSSVALTLLRILPFNGRIISGKVLFDGMNLMNMKEDELRRKVRWKRIAIVFQGAMNALTPVIKVGDQITEALMVHEETDEEAARRRALQLLESVGIDPSRADNYPFEFSGGMKQRAVIAMALANNPDLLIADEPTTALDVLVLAQVLDLLKKLQKELNLSLVVISHDLSVIARLCDSVAIMYAGRIVELADAGQLYERPLHPYTQALLSAFPSLSGEKRRLLPIGGAPPDLIAPPVGCRFHPRCPKVFAPCYNLDPKDRSSEGTYVECHLYPEKS